MRPADFHRWCELFQDDLAEMDDDERAIVFAKLVLRWCLDCGRALAPGGEPCLYCHRHRDGA